MRTPSLTPREWAVALARLLSVAVLTLAAAVPYYRADPPRDILWLTVALIIGFILDRRWIFVAAPLPWLIGVASAFLSGHYVTLRYWSLVSQPSEAFSSAMIGVFGIGVGFLLRRWNRS